jgi:hypothetical protein
MPCNSCCSALHAHRSSGLWHTRSRPKELQQQGAAMCAYMRQHTKMRHYAPVTGQLPGCIKPPGQGWHCSLLLTTAHHHRQFPRYQAHHHATCNVHTTYLYNTRQHRHDTGANEAHATAAKPLMRNAQTPAKLPAPGCEATVLVWCCRHLPTQSKLTHAVVDASSAQQAGCLPCCVG